MAEYKRNVERRKTLNSRGHENRDIGRGNDKKIIRTFNYKEKEKEIVQNKQKKNI